MRVGNFKFSDLFDNQSSHRMHDKNYGQLIRLSNAQGIGMTVILTSPIGRLLTLGAFEYVFMRNSRSLEKSKMFDGVSSPAKFAL